MITTADKPIDKPNAKQQAFIEEWLVNGHNATKAYSKAYPDAVEGVECSASRLLRNAKVKAEIDRRMAEIGAKTDWTYDLAKAKLMAAYDLAEKHSQPAAMVSSIVSTNRMYGMDKDNDAHKEQAPEQLTEQELQLVKEQARRAQLLKLSTG